MLKKRLTPERIKQFISIYKSSPEFNDEEGQILEEQSIIYVVKTKLLHELDSGIKEKIFEGAVADKGRFSVFSSHGDINMQLKTSDGKVVNGEYEVVMDRRTLELENGALHEKPPKMLEIKISPSVMALRSNIHILEDAEYSKDEIQKYIEQTDWEAMEPVKIVEMIKVDSEIPKNQRNMNKSKEMQIRMQNEVIRDGRKNRGSEGWIR